MIFSPRTNLALISWSMVIGSTYGMYSLWGWMIEKRGGYWEQSDTTNFNP
jgi:hypothetical protein